MHFMLSLIYSLLMAGVTAASACVRAAPNTTSPALRPFLPRARRAK